MLRHCDGSGAAKVRCVFCLHNRVLSDEQILLEGDSFYLCAPRGQLIEGFLAIAPRECVGSLSLLPTRGLSELARIRAIVEDFYRVEYGVSCPTFYEQGRGGGGARMDAIDRFPLHTHLCGVPIACDLHSGLERRFLPRGLEDLADLASVAKGCPYLYVSCVDRRGVCKSRAYISASDEDRKQLERARLKVEIARLLALPQRGDWRDYPGDLELSQLIRRFCSYRARHSLPSMIRMA